MIDDFSFKIERTTNLVSTTDLTDNNSNHNNYIYKNSNNKNELGR